MVLLLGASGVAPVVFVMPVPSLLIAVTLGTDIAIVGPDSMHCSVRWLLLTVLFVSGPTLTKFPFVVV